LSINSLGQVVGYSQIANGVQHATLWNGTAATDLGSLSGSSSFAYGINNAGQVVGTSNGHALLWSGSTLTDLGNLGGSYAAAMGINNAGQMVGYSFTASGAQHAILWNGTTATDLNSLLDASLVGAGWVLNRATDINDQGVIVGEAWNAQIGGGYKTFLLAPVPEPETYAMLLAGLGLIGVVGRRRTTKSIVNAGLPVS
jgi:probable HAF family extracellular repeat protein